MVAMLMVRGVRPARRSARSSACLSTLKLPPVESSRPPAASRNEPTRAGRQAILRVAMPPPRARCMP